MHSQLLDGDADGLEQKRKEKKRPRTNLVLDGDEDYYLSHLLGSHSVSPCL